MSDYRYSDSPFNGIALKALTAGRAAKPFVLTAGGKLGVGKVVLTGNILAGDLFVFNGVSFTAMAAGAAGELQFNVGVSLTLSLDALITALNACTNVLVSRATYTKTDGATAVTATMDNYAASDNGAGFLMTTTHVSAVVTAVVGGLDMVYISQDRKMTNLAVPTGVTNYFTLAAGDEGQEKTIYASDIGTAIVLGDFEGANVQATFDAVTDFLQIAYLNGQWRTVLNVGVTLA